MDNQYISESNNKALFKYFVFLICPLFSFYLAIKTINTKSSRNIFVLFAALFGFTVFVPAAKGGINLSVDSTYYRIWFEQIYSQISFPEFIHRVYRWLTFDIDYQSGEIIKDIYLEVVGYFSSYIGDTYHIMFMFASIVFSILTYKSLSFLTRLNNYQYGYYCLCVLLIFTFNQFINIHWLRFPTAAWLAVYSIFQIFVNNNKKYYFILPLTWAIHGSFAFILLILVVVILTSKFEKVWVLLFFVSIFISIIPQCSLEGLFSFLPERMSAYSSYSSAEGISERARLVSERRTGFFIELSGIAINLYINLLMYFIIKKVRKVRDFTSITNIYPILLGLLTVVNVFSFIKEFSERFRWVILPLLAFVWLSLYSIKDKERKIIFAAPLLFGYQMALYGYLYYMTASIYLFLPPVFSIPYYLITGDMIYFQNFNL